MQPVVGVWADNSRSKWGRRRPFMIGGSLIVGMGLLVLGWTSEIVSIFIKHPDTVSHKVLVSFEQDHDTLQKPAWTIALAVLSIYIVDFAINAGK